MGLREGLALALTVGLVGGLLFWTIVRARTAWRMPQTPDLVWRRAQARRHGLRMAATGIGLGIVGGVITGISYAIAPGGYYVITSGVFVMGTILLTAGLAKMLTGR